MTTAVPTAAEGNGILRPAGATKKRGMATSRAYCWVSMASAMRMPAATHLAA